MRKLVDVLKQYAASCPNKEAVVQGKWRLSYAQLDTLTDQLAQALQRDGVSSGDRVGVLLDNTPNFILAYVAILKVGGIVVPLNPSTTLDILFYTIQNCSPKVLFLENRTSPWFADLASLSHGGRGMLRIGDGKGIPTYLCLPPSVNTNNSGVSSCEDLVAVVYTSGTTGQPKGVMLTHSNLIVIAETGIDFLGLTAQDRVGIITPLFHLYGLREIDSCLRVGGTLVLTRNLTYPVQVLKQLHEEQVTGFSAVPSSLTLFMERYETLLKICQGHLRYITLGTAPAPASLLTRLKEILPTTRLLVTYGLTEASRVCFREVTEPDLKVGSVGRPYLGVTLSILNEKGQAVGVNKPGRVAVKSSMVMKGYWNQVSATQQVLKPDGTLLTPDYGQLDSEGYLFLFGRIDELINSGGEKISPDEIESVLRKHPAVTEVAVAGIPDPNGILGAVVKAYVVYKPEYQPDSDELIRYCASHLEPFKVPKIIEFYDSLPRTVLGKTQKSLLK